jgi:hypothetical protein
MEGANLRGFFKPSADYKASPANPLIHWSQSATDYHQSACEGQCERRSIAAFELHSAVQLFD